MFRGVVLPSCAEVNKTTGKGHCEAPAASSPSLQEAKAALQGKAGRVIENLRREVMISRVLA